MSVLQGLELAHQPVEFRVGNLRIVEHEVAVIVMLDLGNGEIESPDDPTWDIWWEQHDDVVRSLVPHNGAQLAWIGPVAFKFALAAVGEARVRRGR